MNSEKMIEVKLRKQCVEGLWHEYESGIEHKARYSLTTKVQLGSWLKPERQARGAIDAEFRKES